MQRMNINERVQDNTGPDLNENPEAIGPMQQHFFLRRIFLCPQLPLPNQGLGVAPAEDWIQDVCGFVFRDTRRARPDAEGKTQNQRAFPLTTESRLLLT